MSHFWSLTRWGMQGNLRVFTNENNGWWVPIFRYKIYAHCNMGVWEEAWYVKHLFNFHNIIDTHAMLLKNSCNVHSAARERKSETESIWMVGLNNTHVLFVVYKLSDTYPHVWKQTIFSELLVSLRIHVKVATINFSIDILLYLRYPQS